MSDYKNVWEKAKADKAAEDARLLAKRAEAEARRMQSQDDATAWLTDTVLEELKAAKNALAGQLAVEFSEVTRREVHGDIFTSVAFSLAAQRPAYSSPNFVIEVGGAIHGGRRVSIQERGRDRSLDTGFSGSIGEQAGKDFIEFLKRQIAYAASRKNGEPTVDV